MKQVGDYSKLPHQFHGQLDRLGKDESVILEQAKVLKDMGYKDCISPGDGPNANRNSSSKESQMQKMDSNNSTYDSQGKWTQSMGEIREQRRKKFIESQEAMKSNQGIIKSDNDMNMQEKWEASCPFNCFLTKVTAIPQEKEGVFSASFIGS